MGAGVLLTLWDIIQAEGVSDLERSSIVNECDVKEKSVILL